MGQPSPYFIRRTENFDPIEAEFSPFLEEIEPWMKIKRILACLSDTFEADCGGFHRDSRCGQFE